jgi:hypothetical protein
MFEKFDRLNNIQKAGVYFAGLAGTSLLSFGLATSAHNHMENQFDPFKDQGTIPETTLKVEIFESARNISGKLATLKSGLSINDPFYTKKFLGINSVCKSEPVNPDGNYIITEIDGWYKVEMDGEIKYFKKDKQSNSCKNLLDRHKVLTARLNMLNMKIKNPR